MVHTLDVRNALQEKREQGVRSYFMRNLPHGPWPRSVTWPKRRFAALLH